VRPTWKPASKYPQYNPPYSAPQRASQLAATSPARPALPPPRQDRQPERDPAGILYHPDRSRRHEQERLAAAAGQPLARNARLCWPDPGVYLPDPEGVRRRLRPACRRCTARYGITEPVACYLPPHQAVCRRHRLWTGPAARTCAGQLDISPFPEIGRAQRRHLALVHHHPWWHVDTAIQVATRAIYHALRAGTWMPGQRRRRRQLAPGTWHQALARRARRPPQPARRRPRPPRRRDRALPRRRLARRAQPPDARTRQGVSYRLCK
jgi:hypothetical protein